MKDLVDKLHQQFPETKDKCIEVIATELDLFHEIQCIKTYKTPKGYLAVTTTDNTLYLVKV